jgi:DNA-binding CsgD family transcriptional regulator
VAFKAALEEAAAGETGQVKVVLMCDDGQWRRFEMQLSGEPGPGELFVTIRGEPHRQTIAPLLAAFGLSAAEGRVLRHLAEGDSPKKTASRLGVSPNTVRAHLRNLYVKMNVRGINELNREIIRLLG